MAPGTKVYVRWYGNVLEGEVADGDGFMGMTPVRIPLDGHHPVALFFPQHVYESAELAKMQSSPVNSPNTPRSFPEFPGNTEEEPREISRMTVEEYVEEVYVTDFVQRFKESHWDEAHNHLRTECLEEFYQLWRKTHDRRHPNAEASVTCQSHTPKPVPEQPVPQNGTPSNTKQLHKKKPAKAMELSLFD